MATRLRKDDTGELRRADLLDVPVTVRDERAEPEERLKLLMLGTRVPAQPGDGTPGFVLTLASALARSYDVTLLAPRVKGAPRETVVDGVRVVRFGYFPRPLEGLADDAILPNLRRHPWRIIEVPFLVLGFVLAALRLARREDHDVVNAHWIVPAGLVALIVRHLVGPPYVVTIHGGDAYGLNGGLIDRIKGAVLRNADAVAPVSEDIAGTLPGLRDHAVIPMGVPIERIAMAAGPRRPVQGRFLFVGRLAAKKGVDVAIRAIAQVPGSRLRIVGDGPEGDRLRALVDELGVADRIEFTGKMRNGDVLRELAQAHAVLIPSVVAPNGDRDGTPVVLAEAIAAGTPVIASDLGGLSEQVVHGSTGVLVPSGDVGTLASAIRWFVDDQETCEAMARRAWERMRGGPLDLAATRERYADLFDGIIDREDHLPSETAAKENR